MLWSPSLAATYGIQEWDMHKLTLDGLRALTEDIEERNRESRKHKHK